MLAIFATGDLTASISGVFNSFIYAITELLSNILIISIIVAMSRVKTNAIFITFLSLEDLKRGWAKGF